jgi:hypothetical protein
MTAYSLEIRQVTIRIYDFLDHPQSVNKVAQLKPYFEYMPDSHLAVLYPILIVEQTQGGGSGGGTLSASGVSAFMNHTHQTGVSDADFQRVMDSHPDQGVCVVPRERWERTTPYITLFHEVAHAVDYVLHLTPDARYTQADVASVTPACRAGTPYSRHVVEAYARMVYARGDIGRIDPTNDPLVLEAIWSSEALRRIAPGTCGLRRPPHRRIRS